MIVPVLSKAIICVFPVSSKDTAVSVSYTHLDVYKRQYTTYDNHQISAVDMTKEDLNTKNLICYEVITGEHIQMQN